jgi:Holliday junction resolvase RusA-like endonuclease
VIRLIIHGEPASKANSRQLVRFGDRPAVIKSKKARDYERDAVLQIPAHAKVMLQGRLRVTLRIFYASERPDLDESVILDVLQAKKKDGDIVRKGVYLNDRQVREKHVFHAIDRANPRAEIEIEELDPQLDGFVVAHLPQPQAQSLAAKPF